MKLPTVSALAMWTSFGFWRDLPNSARRNEPSGQELEDAGHRVGKMTPDCLLLALSGPFR